MKLGIQINFGIGNSIVIIISRNLKHKHLFVTSLVSPGTDEYPLNGQILLRREINKMERRNLVYKLTLAWEIR